MDCEFEESEFRGPLFNQLERGSHLLWEPGQVYEKIIGIDRASFCHNIYLWNLYGYQNPLTGITLRNFTFPFIWKTPKKKKLLPDFSLNLFIQAKRPTYSSRKNKILIPQGILGKYWYFKITQHQQNALEILQNCIGNDALVIYASPVFHRQQSLYNHTKNQSIVKNTTFPEAITLSGHSTWYYDTSGASGVANPDYKKVIGKQLYEIIEQKRHEKGQYSEEMAFKNLNKLSKNIKISVERQSNRYESTLFVNYLNEIEFFIEDFEVNKIPGIRELFTIELFCFLWKLQWLTF